MASTKKTTPAQAVKSFYATGKRKTSIAKVWLFAGKGQNTVNDKPLEEYFPLASRQWMIQQAELAIQPKHEVAADESSDAPASTPLEAFEFYVRAFVLGGGVSAQAQALRHAIARALCLANPLFRPPLKKVSLLTRDSRIVERKKPGLRSARKRDQYSKR